MLILYQILHSTITNREINNPSPKSYPLTVKSCVTLAFAFLMGSIYSNSVKSSFLDSTFVRPPSRHYMICRFSHLCERVDILQTMLNYSPVCDFPQILLAVFDKPLAPFQAIEVWSIQDPRSSTLSAVEAPVSRFAQLPLVFTERSNTLERLIQHSVLSDKVLRIAEHRNILENQVYSRARYWIPESAMSDSRYTSDSNRYKNIPFVTYDTTREHFDMNSFVMLVSSCSIFFLFIEAAWLSESCAAGRSLIPTRVLNFLKKEVRWSWKAHSLINLPSVFPLSPVESRLENQSRLFREKMLRRTRRYSY